MTRSWLRPGKVKRESGRSRPEWRSVGRDRTRDGPLQQKRKFSQPVIFLNVRRPFELDCASFIFLRGPELRLDARKKIEEAGSKSGKTSAVVKISGCGEVRGAASDEQPSAHWREGPRPSAL